MHLALAASLPWGGRLLRLSEAASTNSLYVVLLPAEIAQALFKPASACVVLPAAAVARDVGTALGGAVVAPEVSECRCLALGAVHRCRRAEDFRVLPDRAWHYVHEL